MPGIIAWLFYFLKEAETVLSRLHLRFHHQALSVNQVPHISKRKLATHFASSGIVAALLLLTAPLVADDQIFVELDGECFARIKQSPEYDRFIAGDLESIGLSEFEISRIALVAAFDGPENLQRSFDVVLQYSNKFTAAVLYTCFQDFMGHPGQAYYHIRRLHESYPPGAAFELEAALFALIRDEPSFRTYVGAHELWPGSQEKTVEINMYSSFAWRLARRSQPYMVNEWTRLSKFTQNERAKAAAAIGLMQGTFTSLSSSQSRTDEFSSLADGVRRLYERACYRKVFAKHTSAIPLPTPYEKFSIRLGDKIGDLVSVIIIDDEDGIVSQARIGKVDVLLLPSVDQTPYVLLIDRGNPYAVGVNRCNFIVKPQFIKD